MAAKALQAALVDFRGRHPRSKSRQAAIQRYCCTQLAARGITGAKPEVCIGGAYRAKDWDVAVMSGDQPLLAISCKSIIGNHGGTVPNRIDDLLGEAVNIHRQWPDAILGYLFMMSRVDESAKKVAWRTALIALGREKEAIMATARADGTRWFEQLVLSVNRASGRTGPDDRPEKFEAVSCALIEFDVPPPFPITYHPATLTPDAFFDALAKTYNDRFGQRRRRPRR